MSIKVPLVIIGAGPAGITAALYATSLGMKVTLVDQGPLLGGASLNQGCVTVKFLFQLNQIIRDSQESGDIGIHFEKPRIDLQKIQQTKMDLIQKIHTKLKKMIEDRMIEFICGVAFFESPQTLGVETAKERLLLEFDHCLIAAGASPYIPPNLLSTSHRVINSTRILELQEIPPRLLVVGGGSIGIEVASIYATFGSAVSLIESDSRVLSHLDPDLVAPLEKRIQKDFKGVHTSTEVLSIKEKGEEVEVVYKEKGHQKAESFDYVVIATGRLPILNILRPEKAGIKVGKNGFIEVNQNLETSNPKILAIGDVKGLPLMIHKANREAVAAMNRIKGEKVEVDKLIYPYIVYAVPEIAWAGLSEREAKEKNIPFKTDLYSWDSYGREALLGEGEGLAKIIYHGENKKVLGVGVVAKNGGSLLRQLLPAVEVGADMDFLRNMAYCNLSSSGFLLESSDQFQNWAGHFYTVAK